MKLPIVPEERGRETLARVLSGEEKTGSVAEKSASDRVFLVATDLRNPSVFNGCDDAAGIRTIAVAEGLSGFDHVTEEYSTGPLSVGSCPTAVNVCLWTRTNNEHVHGYNKNFFLAVSNSLRSFCQVATILATGSSRSSAFLTASVPASLSKCELLN